MLDMAQLQTPYARMLAHRYPADQKVGERLRMVQFGVVLPIRYPRNLPELGLPRLSSQLSYDADHAEVRPICIIELYLHILRAHR